MDFVRRYPLSGPLIALILGILISRAQWVWMTAVSLVVFLLLVVSALRGQGSRQVFFYPLFFLLGFLRAGSLVRQGPPPLLQEWAHEKKEHRLLIKAQSFCRSLGESSFFDGKLLGYYQGESFHSSSAALRWYVGSPSCSVSPGQFYRSRGKFSLPRRFGNPSAFDYPMDLRARGILAGAWIASEEWLVPLGPEDSRALRLRRRGRTLLEKARLDPRVRQMLIGILWGEPPLPSSGLVPLFRDTGLAHVLVVSGLHLGLVFVCGYFCFYAAGVFFPAAMERGWVASAARLLAWGFAAGFCFLVGPAPPVLRALVLLGLLVVVKLWAPRKDIISLCLLAAWVMLLWWPLWLFSISFQLSFAAVMVLVFFGRRFRTAFGPSKSLGMVFGIPLATVAVNGALYPLLALRFHQVSTVAPLANFLAMPLFSFLLLPGLIFSHVLDLFWRGAALFSVESLGTVARALLGILEFLASREEAKLWVGPPSPGLWLLWLMGGGLFSFAKGRAGLLAGLALWASLGWVDRIYPHPAPRELLQLSVLDVGQGEALLLELPQGSALLIDGGGVPHGDFDVGERVVLPELLRRGIRRLKAMVLTHPDGDHALGLIALAKHLEVEEFWIASTFQSLEELPQLKKVLDDRSIPIRPLDNHDWLFSDQVSLKILWPPPDGEIKGGPFSKNNRSLVIRACYREACMLLTGDLERGGEGGLLEGGETLRSEILKVGHHGSRTSTSTEFLNAVAPQWALISAGRDNRFGMPHPEVLQRLRRQGAKIYRTDQSGMIQIGIGGEKVFKVNLGPGGPTPNY